MTDEQFGKLIKLVDLIYTRLLWIAIFAFFTVVNTCSL